MEKRTEEQKVIQVPISVYFAGEEYLIKPLVIRDSRPWRTKLIHLLAPIPELSKLAEETTIDNSEAFEDILKSFMVFMPDQVLDLFFEYAKDLDRDEIEGKATDSEMATAFEQVVEVAFPLASSLPDVMKRLSQ